jgi:hypothetical protein
MATDNSKLRMVAIGASAGGVEALKDFVLEAAHATAVSSERGSEVHRRDRAVDE